jgi:hypothetical protein
MPKSSPRRYSSQRATSTWSPVSSGPVGPIWNSHWPGITSALMPLMVRPAFMHASTTEKPVKHSDARTRESSANARRRTVRFCQRAAVHLFEARAAVEGALRRREAALGPAEHAPVLADHGYASASGR